MSKKHYPRFGETAMCGERIENYARESTRTLQAYYIAAQEDQRCGRCAKALSAQGTTFDNKNWKGKNA